MLLRRLLEAARAGWAAYRNPPGRVPRYRLEPTDHGPRVRWTPLLLRDVEAHPFIVEGLDLLIRICQRKQVTCELTADGLNLGIDSLNLMVQTVEELGIINEVYVDKCYNVSLGRPFVLIDVGMNVGFTSLWFASRPDVEAVYAFEPFTPTYQQARRNLLDNPGPRAKVHPHNFGLAAETKQLDLPYDPSWKGKSSLNGLGGGWHSAGEITSQRIELRDAEAIFGKVFADHPDTPMVAKIDCEGAEYEILPALSRSDLLDRVDGILIEWHEKGPAKLVEVLQHHGFKVVCIEPDGPNIGMIYAFR